MKGNDLYKIFIYFILARMENKIFFGLLVKKHILLVFIIKNKKNFNSIISFYKLLLMELSRKRIDSLTVSFLIVF